MYSAHHLPFRNLRIRCEELVNLMIKRKAVWSLETITAAGIDGILKEIRKEVILVYPEILLGAFKFCFRQRRFFRDCKKQRLFLLKNQNLQINMSVRYNGKSSRKIDSTKTSVRPFTLGQVKRKESSGKRGTFEAVIFRSSVGIFPQ